MTISIETKTEIIGGKGYPLTITRILGLQQIQLYGKPVWVTAITYHDSREGCTSCFRLYNGPIPPDGEVPNRLPASVEARVKEIAAQILFESAASQDGQHV